MSEEGGGGAAASGGIGFGIVFYIKPAPSLAIVKFWQGIVEVATRVAILVGLLVTFIACSVAQNEAAGLDNNANINRAQAAAGWTIFLGVIGFIYGVIFLLFRFLNPGFMTAFRMFVLIEDVVFNAVLAVLIMTGAASLAAGSGYLTSALNGSDGQFDNIIRSVRNAIGAAAFFAFIMMFMYIFLAVWIILYLVFKWDIKSGGGEKPAAAPV